MTALQGAAQNAELSNWRTRPLSIQQPVDTLDSLSIIPYSLSVFERSGQAIDSSLYRLNGRQIEWDTSLIRKPPLQVDIRYRVLPFYLGKTYQRIDTSLIQADADGNYIGFEYNPYESSGGLIDFKGLDYNGSFSRGISFGNSQNLVLNSSFNLQLAGKLGDDVEVLAAITDQNIPLQPEGNTQQLQEFDKIFIQLKKENNVFIAGDYELARPNSYFMNYFKKLQGATYSNSKDAWNGQLTTKISGAVARGKFVRNNITPIEGNQGPYRLSGREGERFIIVLAGTEKVYIDGILLKRGLEEDYIIDYNQAEVTFTNKQLITKDRRLIVEFEYNTQQFLRSLYALNTEYQTDRMRLYFNLYSEQDGKNSGGIQNLDSLDRAILRNSGDALDNAFGSGIDTIEEFSEFRVLYRLADTTYLLNGRLASEQILVYSTNPETALYNGSFLDVGPGNGNYVIDNSIAANGRIFRWVAPDSSGQLQGNFTLGQKLIAPNQQQMYSLGVEYQLSENTQLQTEIALSNTDLNRFSSRDDGDNLGAAVFSKMRHRAALGQKERGWTLSSRLDYEYVASNFNALNPYRPAEFTRDWNIGLNTIRADSAAQEQLIKAGLSIEKRQLGSLEYNLNTFLREDLYTGFKHDSRLRIGAGGFRIDAQGSYLTADRGDENSRFFRPRIDISKTFEKLQNWQVGAYGEREHNARFRNQSDTLLATSFYYDMYRLYLKSPEKENFGFAVNYTQRFDYAPVNTQFEKSTTADEFNLNGYWNQKRHSQLKWNLTYRQLRIDDDELTNQAPQETFLGRTDYSLQLMKGAIRFNTSYELGSGQEPRLQITYLKVNPGEGTHIWLDSIYNNDGLIQPNEMEIAPFQDIADYIRISTVTNEFIRTNNIQFNQSLRLNPRKLWYKKKGILKILSKFATQSTLLLNRKTRENDDIAAWNPFQLNVADSSLVAINSRIANTLFFNRANPVFDVQLGMFDNRNRTVLTTGFESRRLAEQFLRLRWNLNQKFSSQLYLRRNRNFNDSEFFDIRDYILENFQIEPQLTYLPKQNFRLIASYTHGQRKNVLEGGGNESSIQNEFTLETTYNQSSKTSIRLNLSLVSIDFDGERNTPVEFAMLEGLRNGQNYLWNLALDRRLGRNLQMSISYEGRKTGIAQVVHVGRAQLRATF
ncbi:MAG: hypothetical protein AAF990_19430 [Bacteroidota bacterium]